MFADIPTHEGSGVAQSPDNKIARMSQHGRKGYRTSCAPVAGEPLKPLILTLTGGAPGCRRARPHLSCGAQVWNSRSQLGAVDSGTLTLTLTLTCCAPGCRRARPH